MPLPPPAPDPPAGGDDLVAALAAYERQLRHAPAQPDGRFEQIGPLGRTVLPAPRMSWIDSDDLTGFDLDLLIRAQIDWFRAHGGPFEWTVYAHDPGAQALLERLAAHGFERDDPEAVMVFDLTAALDTLADPAPDDTRIVEIGAERLDDVQRILEQVWNRDFVWIPGRLGTHLQIPGYLHVFLAETRRGRSWEPAATAWVYLPPGSDFARLYGGSTLPEARGRGLYRALLAARAAAAREARRRWLTVDAGPMSRPIVARLGFRELTRVWACTWRPEQG